MSPHPIKKTLIEKKKKKKTGVAKPQKSNFFSANLLGEFAKIGHII